MVVVVGLFDPLCVTFLLIAQTTIQLRGVVKQCEFDTHKKSFLHAMYRILLGGKDFIVLGTTILEIHSNQTSR